MWPTVTDCFLAHIAELWNGFGDWCCRRRLLFLLRHLVLLVLMMKLHLLLLLLNLRLLRVLMMLKLDLLNLRLLLLLGQWLRLLLQ
jgi:hypothetical protein